jgi:hypothetical protein
MARLLSTLILIAIVGAAVAFVVAPGVAFFAVRSAAQAQDVQGLAQLVDFGALRTSLRPQLASDPGAAAIQETPRGRWWEDPLGAFRRTVEPMRPAPSVDPYLTPAALVGLTLGEGRESVDRALLNDVRVEPGQPQPWPRVRYWGVNRCRLAIPSETTAEETIFTFERRGLYDWKLVHIGLPSGVGAAAVVRRPPEQGGGRGAAPATSGDPGAPPRLAPGQAPSR